SRGVHARAGPDQPRKAPKSETIIARREIAGMQVLGAQVAHRGEAARAHRFDELVRHERAQPWLASVAHARGERVVRPTLGEPEQVRRNGVVERYAAAYRANARDVAQGREDVVGNEVLRD